MKKQKLFRTLLSVIVLLLITNVFLNVSVKAKNLDLKSKSEHCQSQSTIYLGDFEETISGVVHDFSAYGDTGTGYITEIYDNTISTDTVLDPNLWSWYENGSGVYGTDKVEFHIAGSPNIFLLYEGLFNYD